MRNEKEIKSRMDNIVSVIIGLALFGIFLFFYHRDEERRDAKFSSCSVITIAYPQRFIPKSRLYYYFYLNNSKVEYSYIIPYPTMGKFNRNSTLLKERFWIQVYCGDYQVNKIYWDAKVPDTLQFIPKNGWSKIPYGLADN